MKTVAVLIPTRKRIDRLLRTIESVKETSSADNVEICLRVDGDDMETISAVPLIFTMHPNTRVLIGSRNGGYASLCDFYTELSRVCDARWIFIMNDDITLEGAGWDEQLKGIPEAGVLVWPQTYQLGGSRYDSPGWVCPIVPNRCWEQLGKAKIENPVDVWFKLILMKRAGWKVQELKGLTVNHQRDAEAELEKHRNG